MEMDGVMGGCVNALAPFYLLLLYNVSLCQRGFRKGRQRPLVQTLGVVLDLVGACILCIYPHNDW